MSLSLPFFKKMNCRGNSPQTLPRRALPCYFQFVIQKHEAGLQCTVHVQLRKLIIITSELKRDTNRHSSIFFYIIQFIDLNADSRRRLAFTASWIPYINGGETGLFWLYYQYSLELSRLSPLRGFSDHPRNLQKHKSGSWFMIVQGLRVQIGK